MSRRHRVLVAPQWCASTCTTSSNSLEACSIGAVSSLQERVARLVSGGPKSDDQLATAEASGSAVDGLPTAKGARVPASPVAEPAPASVLYPPSEHCVPPYAPLRSAWPEAALVDFVKQQALFPIDVNVCGEQTFGCGDAGIPRSSLLQSISDEAEAYATTTPASASYRYVQLLAELCARNSGDQYALQVGREPPPRPASSAAVAPVVAVAAAAAGLAPTPQLEAIAMEGPATLVGFEGDWLAVQPSALPHWDKLSLEPCGPAKAAEFHVLCPEQHASAARMFAKDIAAAFTALRLGSHTPARTPSHLHVIDGVIPVPLDLGPGPPQPAGPGGTEDAAGGAGVSSWHPLARRPDRLVVRSAILGFRSNHAPASVGGEGGWEPQEPCYRPRQPEAAQGPAPLPQVQPSQNLHFWRNLRHVGRQLQRHLLLPQQPVSRPSGGSAGGTGSSAGVGAGAGDDAGEVLGLAPTSLVVYVVPPTESPDDVARALLEVAACLGPATPAARGPQAVSLSPVGAHRGSDRPGPGLACNGGGSTERGASSPPEPPAPLAGVSTPGSTEHGGWAADAEDAALLARLGGAAKHLYRCSGDFAKAPAAAQLSPQLDLPESPATEVTLQLLLPSSLYDISGSCVRASACAVYNKLCCRQASYGAAAAHQSSLGGTVPDNGVRASCSGRTALYRPLVALAPVSVGTGALGLQPAGGGDAQTPTATAATPGAMDASAAPQPPCSPPSMLHGCYAWRRWSVPSAHGGTAGPVEERAWLALAFCDADGLVMDARALMLGTPRSGSGSDLGLQGRQQTNGPVSSPCHRGCQASEHHEAGPAPSLDALVCRAVMSHAQLLRRQLSAPACGGEAGSAAVASARNAATLTEGAVEADGELGLAILKLGPPTRAETDEWQRLVESGGPSGADGGNAGARVSLAWLEPHPSVAVPPGGRLPQGGFALRRPAPGRHWAAFSPRSSRHGCSDGSLVPPSPPAPISLCAFPTRQPPSLAAAAAEVLDGHVRLLSLHPFPLGFAGSGRPPRQESERLPNGRNSGPGLEDDSVQAVPCKGAAKSKDLHQVKRQRLDGDNPTSPAALDLEWPMLGEIYRLCALRDSVIAAQTPARSGGQVPGRRAGGETEAPQLLPWHAAVCQRLLRVLLATEGLAAAASGSDN